MSCTRLERFSTTSAPLMASTWRACACAHGDADAVALDQPAALVGDEVGDLGRVEAAVDLAGERFELRPDLLLADHLPQLVVARVAGREAGHLHQELQEAALGVGAAVGVLPDFDEAGDLLVVQ